MPDFMLMSLDMLPRYADSLRDFLSLFSLIMLVISYFAIL